MSIIPQAIVNWCFCPMLLQYSINTILVIGEGTLIEASVDDGTIVGGAKRHQKYLRFPDPYVVASFWTFSWRGDMTFSRDVNILTW